MIDAAKEIVAQMAAAEKNAGSGGQAAPSGSGSQGMVQLDIPTMLTTASAN
jgi:hypothetical protein